MKSYTQAVGVDMYNQSITGDVAKTLNSIKSDSDHTPCVVTFEPGIASRDGGHVYENISGTLRATPGDNQMTVAYDIGEARLRTPQEYIEKSLTITARCGTGGNNVPAVVFENHAQDSRYKGPLEVAQPVTATYGMGGNNQPLVICLQGNGIDRADTAGCNDKGWKEDVSYTLNTIDRPAVVYTVDEKMGQTYIHEDQANTLAARDFKQPQTVVYPEKTGTLMANSHPGSYCGQDAYNDMFVVEKRGGGRSNSRSALCNRLQVSATTADRTGEGGNRDG